MPAQAVNFSTRMRVDVGDKVGIGGFIITGSGPRQVLVRAIGPSLTSYGIPAANVLADPVLELHGPTGFATITNNNWRDTQEHPIQDTGIPPTNDLESAILATLNPGAYTAIVRRNGNTQLGIALVEAYDLDALGISGASSSSLANISTRAFCGMGGDVIIAGFILGNGGGDDSVIVRGLGPSLTAPGVPNVLANPTLELRNSDGTLLLSNNDWHDNAAQAAQITAAGLAPSNNLESAIAATLSPGLYTALLAGLNNTTGNALVEVYDRGAVAPVPTPTPGGATATPGPTSTPGPTATPGGATPTPGPTATPGAATPTPTATPGGPPFAQNFDSVGAPALPTGWVATNVQEDTGIDATKWVTSVTLPDTAPNDAFIPDQNGVSDKVLDTPDIHITSGTAQLSFRNNFDTEFSSGTYWDGGVLEVSSQNINGGVFTDVTDPAVGGDIPTGPYTGEISGLASNPLAGRMAWSGTSPGYQDTVVNLGPTVNGHIIKLRFRMGTDLFSPAPGWRIDSLTMVGGSLAAP